MPMNDIAAQLPDDAKWQSPADMARIVGAFIGRRLHAVLRAADTERETGDVWLQFCPRGDEASLLRLTANRGYVTSWYGSSSWCLRIEVEKALPAEELKPWNPFWLHTPSSEGSLRDWALTELWASSVSCNVFAPQGYWLQDVGGGLALLFSNSAESPYSYHRLLGATYPHHNEDAVHKYFCAEILPPLVGSGLWQRIAYLKDDTLRDDEAVCHSDEIDYRGPAVLGCLEQFNRELYDFEDWFEKEPSFRAFRSKVTHQWYAYHVHLLLDLMELLGWADTPRSLCNREKLAQEVALYGLGTMFSDAWYERDGATANAPGAKINASDLKEIRRRYVPLREAYRQWFLLHRQASIADQRLRAPSPDEGVPAWILTLDAALTRGSSRFDEIRECPTARILRDDFRDPWAPFEDLDWIMKNGGVRREGPQDVLIEGDEERAGYLRITLWPVLNRRDQLIVMRVAADILQTWWSLRATQLHPARKTGLPLMAETSLTLAEIVARATQPPGVEVKTEELPPYTQDDIGCIAHLRMQGENVERWSQISANDPELVWTFDSQYLRIPLLIGRDCHPQMTIDAGHRARERVIFPAVWPPFEIGRDPLRPFYLMWSQSHWREERIEGRQYRRENWLLPVQRWVPLTADVTGPHGWRWGLIDVDGRFVQPCRYPAMGFPQVRNLGKPAQPEQSPPLGRREPWCWVWVGEDEHADGLLDTSRKASVGDVIEVWSGKQMNSIDQAVRRLDSQFMIVCHRTELSKIDTDEPPAHGLCNLATEKHGPIQWRRINTFGLSITHAAPAQDAETGSWGYVDDNGEPLAPSTYARAEQFDDGLAIIQLSILQAKALGLTLTLPDGTRQGPVGVFGPNGAASLGQWFVEPRWRDVEGEYEGHFIVQDAEGRWGMVTPDGDAITPFVARQERAELNGDILQQVIKQFKRVQRRRFIAWMQEARTSGSLAVMAGKLRSSFGAYDFGALPNRDIAVRLTRDLPSAPSPHDNIALLAGAEFSWCPGQRNYYRTIDLRTHAMIGLPAEHGPGCHSIAVPWDALTLATPAMDDGTDEQRRCIEHLHNDEHLTALYTLLDSLAQFATHLEADTSVIANDAESACGVLEVRCSRLAEMLLTCEPLPWRQLAISDLRDDLERIDFPSILNRARYQEDNSEHRPLYGPDAPRWIGDDGEESAVAPHHSWALAIGASLDKAVAAYQTWLPLFKAATADEDEQKATPEKECPP